MESYLNFAPCLFFSCCDKGILLDVNEKLCKILGYSKAELIGNKTDVFFTVATRIFQQTHLFPLLKIQGYANEIFITLKKKNNEEVPILLNAERNTRDGIDVQVFIGIIVENRKKFEQELIAAKKTAETALRDNTALKQAQQDLQKNMEQLDQQMQLVRVQNVELKQFNRVVTHDLQEPLRKLSFFSSMLTKDREDITQNEILAKLKGLTLQMQAIISGLQQYVWLTESTMRFSVVDQNQIITTVQEQLRMEYPQIELSVKSEPFSHIVADNEQMNVLFYQLLSNVIRFRKHERKAYATFTCYVVKHNKFEHLTGKYDYDDFLKLQLKDEGVGFDAHYGEQVFELFRRLHPVSGHGIGLALCKKIVENHKGTITIQSSKEKGTSVTILLPLRRNETKIDE